MVTKITPAFHLKGINHKDTCDRINQILNNKINKDLNYVLSMLPKISVTSSNIISSESTVPVQYISPELDIEESGKRVFELFDKSGGELPHGGRCDFCKRDFTDVVIGYPVKDDYKIALVGGEKKMTTTYFCEGVFDTYNCALGYLNKFVNHPINKCYVNVIESKRLLHEMFEANHKGKILIPAPDPSLLISNGGSVSEEDWCNSNYCYSRTESIITIPIKVDYVRTAYKTNDVHFIQNSKNTIYTNTYNNTTL